MVVFSDVDEGFAGHWNVSMSLAAMVQPNWLGLDLCKEELAAEHLADIEITLSREVW